MKIIVYGSIGFGGIEKIRRLYNVIKKRIWCNKSSFQKKDTDYSSIEDFRDKQNYPERLLDMIWIIKVDVLVILTNSPSYGTAMEMIIARNNGKKIILLTKDPVLTPWPIHFSDLIVRKVQNFFHS